MHPIALICTGLMSASLFAAPPVPPAPPVPTDTTAPADTSGAFTPLDDPEPPHFLTDGETEPAGFHGEHRRGHGRSMKMMRHLHQSIRELASPEAPEDASLSPEQTEAIKELMESAREHRQEMRAERRDSPAPPAPPAANDAGRLAMMSACISTARLMMLTLTSRRPTLPSWLRTPRNRCADFFSPRRTLRQSPRKSFRAIRRSSRRRLISARRDAGADHAGLFAVAGVAVAVAVGLVEGLVGGLVGATITRAPPSQ